MFVSISHLGVRPAFPSTKRGRQTVAICKGDLNQLKSRCWHVQFLRLIDLLHCYLESKRFLPSCNLPNPRTRSEHYVSKSSAIFAKFCLFWLCEAQPLRTPKTKGNVNQLRVQDKTLSPEYQSLGGNRMVSRSIQSSRCTAQKSTSLVPARPVLPATIHGVVVLVPFVSGRTTCCCWSHRPKIKKKTLRAYYTSTRMHWGNRVRILKLLLQVSLTCTSGIFTCRQARLEQ